MFQSAIEAAAAAASAWTPESADPAGGSGCCDLCLGRYRVLVLGGPLDDLPHAVAHAAVLAVDDTVSARVEDATDELRWATWITLAPDRDRDAELHHRILEAREALVRAALHELSTAEWRLDDLRRRCIDPAIEAYLETRLTTEVPRQWHL